MENHSLKYYLTTSGKAIYSLRVNRKYRCLLNIDGDTVVFLKVANHEETYESVRKIDVLSIMNQSNVLVKNESVSFINNLFAGLSNFELNKLGIENENEIKAIRSITNESELKRLAEGKIITNQAFENLEMELIENDFNKLVSDYRDRYKRACDLLITNVIEPALAHEDLDEEIKVHVAHTKDRILSKGSLQEIINFYNDALMAKTGIAIKDEFYKHGLKAFEDYQEEILKIAKGIV